MTEGPLSLLAMHQLPGEVLEEDLFSLYQRFMVLTGAKVWTKRLQKVSDIVHDPFRRSFYGEEFPLERAMLATRLALNQHRRLPLPRSSELYQLYAFISNCVAVHERLSAAAQKALVGRLNDALGKGSLTPLVFEMSVIGALSQRRCKVGFSDFETPGGFDFLVESEGLQLEIECKTVTEDIGRKVKRDSAIALYQRVKKQIHAALPSMATGAIIRVVVNEALSRENVLQNNVAQGIQDAIRDKETKRVGGIGAIEFIPFSMGSSPFGSPPRTEIPQSRVEEFVFQVTGQRNKEAMAIYGQKSPAVILVLTSDKQDRGIHDWLREPRESVSTQFSGERPAVLCVHFSGLTNEQLVDLAGQANGLAVGARRILNNDKRPHLVSVVFFAKPSASSLQEDERGISQPGNTYILHNSLHPAHADKRSNVFAATELQ